MDNKVHNDQRKIGSLYYVYSNETITYTDPEKFLEEYKAGLDIYSPNGIRATLATKDIELGFQLFEIAAGEFGYSVDREKYFELANKYGPGSPEIFDAAYVLGDEQPDSPFQDENALVSSMEQVKSEAGPAIGQITFYNQGKVITYSSREQLINDFTRAITAIGGGAISATPLIPDDELAFKLDEIEANSLGFAVDKEKYLDLLAEYGQGSPELSKSFYEPESFMAPQIEEELEV